MITSDMRSLLLPFDHPFHLKERFTASNYRVDCQAVIRSTLLEISQLGLIMPEGFECLVEGRIKTREHAEYLISMLNEPRVNLNSQNHIQSDHQDWQRYEYITSNLTGFIFYFLCLFCERRCKYLYYHDPDKSFRCSECSLLRYH